MLAGAGWTAWRRRKLSASTIIVVALAVMALVLIAIQEVFRVRELYG